MNLKMLLPDYRCRYLKILDCIKVFENKKLASFLDIGCGESENHQEFIKYFKKGVGIDVNQEDVNYAKKLNKKILIDYFSQGYENLILEKKYNCIICSEVLEHVNNPEILIEKISKLLKPNGLAIITFPNKDFPFTYDPINFILNKINLKIPIGAYAFGHEKLICPAYFEKIVNANGLSIIKKDFIVGYILSILQMYWPGLVQKIIKKNSYNKKINQKKKFYLRFNNKIPSLVKVIDIILRIEDKMIKNKTKSVGLFYVLRK